jgi:transcriptional regulator with XRE-family HTH domain
VEVSLVIKQRLKELGLEQQDLASAAQVTESYISQLLTREKAPPAPDRTDIYEKIGKFLKLPNGELAKLAGLQRRLTRFGAVTPLYLKAAAGLCAEANSRGVTEKLRATP